MQVSISSITISPRTPGHLHKKFAPTLGLFHPSFCRGGGGFVGIAPKGREFVYKRIFHVWNFHHDGKNWRLTTLSGLFGVYLGFICCSEILCFKRKLFDLKIEPKLKHENDCSEQRLRMRNSLIDRHLILRVLSKICLHK